MKKNQANSDYKDLWEKVNRKVDIEPETSAEAPEEVKEEQQAEQEETNEENDVPSDSTEAKSTCKIATQSQAISYSLKVLSFLESKMKTYNKENKKRIPVARFKDAFCLAASEFEFQNSNNITIDSKEKKNLAEEINLIVNNSDFSLIENTSNWIESKSFINPSLLSRQK